MKAHQLTERKWNKPSIRILGGQPPPTELKHPLKPSANHSLGTHLGGLHVLQIGEHWHITVYRWFPSPVLLNMNKTKCPHSFLSFFSCPEFSQCKAIETGLICCSQPLELPQPCPRMLLICTERGITERDESSLSFNKGKLTMKSSKRESHMWKKIPWRSWWFAFPEGAIPKFSPPSTHAQALNYMVVPSYLHKFPSPPAKPFII